MGMNDEIGKYFSRMFHQQNIFVEIVRVIDGTKPSKANLEDYDGILMSGSSFMVTDQHPWSVDTGNMIKPIVERGLTPILGVCYGHQLISHTLGGNVEYAAIRQIGSKSCVLTPEARTDRLFSVFDKTDLVVHVLHRQVVTAIPPAACIMAYNDIDPFHALKLGPRCWSVQFHPELKETNLRTIVEFNKDMLPKDGLNYDTVLASVQKTRDGEMILRRFAEICIERNQERKRSFLRLSACFL